MGTLQHHRGLSQNKDVAAKNPEKLKDLQQLFLVQAKRYQVLPLDNSILQRLLTARPSPTAGRTEFTYSGEISGLPDGSVPNTLAKSFSIAAEWRSRRAEPRGCSRRLEVASAVRPLPGEGQTRVHLQPDGSGRFRWEGKDPLTPGKHTILFDFKYDGPGIARAARALSVDGKKLIVEDPAHHPGLMTVDESFDVGVDTRTGVDDKTTSRLPLHREARQLTIKLVPPNMAAE